MDDRAIMIKEQGSWVVRRERTGQELATCTSREVAELLVEELNELCWTPQPSAPALAA